MDLESIQNRIRAIDNEIVELNSQKRRNEKEIEEAEQAAESAKKVRREFDSFVSRKRSTKDKTANQSVLKSFASFINRATAMLSGREYTQASSKVDELVTITKNKINRHTEDLNYCKSEIRKLQRQRDSLMCDYNTLMNQQNESEES